MNAKSFILTFISILSILLIVLPSQVYATDPDLDGLSYEELLQKFQKLSSPQEKLDFSKYYLDRAILDKNYEQIIESYLLYAKCNNGTDIGLRYCEKAIELATTEKSESHICKSHIEIGNQYYYRNNLVDALLNYKRADSLNQTLKNQLFEIKIKHGKAVVELEKNELEAAKQLFDQNLEYFSNQDHINENSKGYILTIQGISQYYMRKGLIEEGLEIVDDAIVKSINLGLTEEYKSLVLSAANCQIILENYPAAIDSVNKVLDSKQLFIKQNLATAYTINIYSYLNIGDPDLALRYLQNLENLYEEHEEVIPSLKIAYSVLGDYFKESQDFKKESYYRNKQIELDSTINQNRLEMMRNLEKLENSFSVVERKASSAYPFFLGILILSCLLLAYLYKRLLSKPIRKSEEREPLPTKQDKQIRTSELNSKIVEKVLIGLKDFEKKGLFLDADCSLVSTSNILNSNTLYVSKVINNAKGKNFRSYINDLRIGFIVEKLKSDPIYSQYTLKALSDECGFKNVRSFSVAFKDKMGCSPKEYLSNTKNNIIN